MLRAKRLLILTLALVFSVTLAHQVRKLWPMPILLGMLGLSMLMVFSAWWWRTRIHLSFVLIVCAVCVGSYAYTQSRATVLMMHQIPTYLNNETINITGTIVSSSIRTPYGVRFLLKTNLEQDALVQNGVFPRLLSVAWNDDDLPTQALEAGQEWRLPLRLRVPRATQNEGVFDQEQNWFAQGIRGFAVVRVNKSTLKSDYPELLARHYGVLSWVSNARASALAQIGSVLSPHDTQTVGLFKALTFGDQHAISAEQWSLFQKSGITHLVSISGLHITMLAALFGWMIAFLWRLSPGLCTYMPSIYVGQWAGVLLALIYALFTGWALPAQRTVYMLTLWLFLSRLGVFNSALRVVCWALWGVLLFDPFAVLSIGFWLSFGAVFWLVMAFGQISKDSIEKLNKTQRLKHLLMPQLGIGLAMLPVTLYFFHQASLLGVLVNIIAIPLVSVILVPLLLLSSMLQLFFGFAMPMLLASDFLALCISGLIKFVGYFEYATLDKNITWWQALLMTLLSLCVVYLLRSRYWWRSIGLIGMSLILFFIPENKSDIAIGEAKIHVLDVGQGSAVLIQTANQNWLYDTGTSYGQESDAGRRVIVPYLRAHNIRRIHMMVLSHNDIDHTGGAVSVANLMKVDSILTPISSVLIAKLGINVQQTNLCQTGSIFNVDGIRLSILSPSTDLLMDDSQSDNRKSCVLRIDSPRGEWRSLLLTGDIDGVQEANLVVSPDGGVFDWASDVIMLPHHGSGSSSTLPFIEATKPKMAFVQAGYLNSFGHPHRRVLQRYKDANILIKQTVMSGSLTFCIGCSKANTRSWRDDGYRYWWLSILDSKVVK